MFEAAPFFTSSRRECNFMVRVHFRNFDQPSYAMMFPADVTHFIPESRATSTVARFPGRQGHVFLGTFTCDRSSPIPADTLQARQAGRA